MSANGNGAGARLDGAGLEKASPASAGLVGATMSFRIDPERAALVLVARSNAGPITFGVSGLEGSISAQVSDGEVETSVPPSARLEVPVQRLTCGNGLYDAELLRRVDARLYPRAVVELRAASPVGATGRYHVEGLLTFHGVTRQMAGTVAVSIPEPGRMVIDGEQVLDMRYFEITPPAVAMLRIYPEVRVQLHLEADVAEVPGMAH
ncbi:MAG TPA: YceI family protein [Acidimicrobiia bacterium]|nr:YceI family protein [Acidimicrobiia bacterium]